MIASHLLTASDVYSGELGSRPGDITDYDETPEQFFSIDKIIGL